MNLGILFESFYPSGVWMTLRVIGFQAQLSLRTRLKDDIVGGKVVFLRRCDNMKPCFLLEKESHLVKCSTSFSGVETAHYC